MKSSRLISAAGAMGVCFAASAALVHVPALDQPYGIEGNVPNAPGFINLLPQASHTFVADVTPHATRQVIGFSFGGVVTNIGAEPTWWASDTRMTITLKDHNNVVLGSHTIGGFHNLTNPWDFQGAQSSANDLYIHGLSSPFGDGVADYAWKANPLSQNVPVGQTWKWEFKFEQDTFLTHAIWKGIVVDLHLVPAPGSAAVLGVCALFAARRRRV